MCSHHFLGEIFDILHPYGLLVRVAHGILVERRFSSERQLVVGPCSLVSRHPKIFRNVVVYVSGQLTLLFPTGGRRKGKPTVKSTPVMLTIYVKNPRVYRSDLRPTNVLGGCKSVHRECPIVHVRSHSPFELLLQRCQLLLLRRGSLVERPPAVAPRLGDLELRRNSLLPVSLVAYNIFLFIFGGGGRHFAAATPAVCARG